MCEDPPGADARANMAAAGTNGAPDTDSAPQGAAARADNPDGLFWAELVKRLQVAESITGLVRELALQSQLLQRDGECWLLRIERVSLNQGSNRERLEQALAEAGHPVRLALEMGTVSDSPARRQAAAAQHRLREAEASLMGDPFVQRMVQQFGGKMVPGTLRPLLP